MPLPPSDSADLDRLAEFLAEDMRQRWQAGERPITEDYLKLYPALREQPAAAAELIYEEICLGREHGQAGRSSEVLRRFPQWASRLRVMLDLHDTLALDDPDYPDLGEVLGDFHLLAELGRGLRGRVYLARQPSLGGRPVVVKLIPPSDFEHHVLARLQHTHIVPLYAVHDDATRHLRLLCMPFFGGATLAAVLDRLASAKPPGQQTAHDLWQALAAVAPPEAGAVAAAGSIPRRAREDYAEAVCWIGACLADALSFAHERGLLHLDVKPANVLLTAEGLPMLLDFHLAQAALPAGSPAPARLGGTPAYCSPEQRDAMEAVRHGQTVGTAIDGRSDLYSLGLVLYEALAGCLPPAGRRAPLCACNRQVSAGLSDVIACCLARRPEHRYPNAAALADDLRRHLADLPLRGVGNRDLGERWCKWRRRRPAAVGVLGLLAVLLMATALAVTHVGQRRQQARAALEEGTAELHRGGFAAAREAFRRGLAVAEGLPFHGDLQGELADGLRRAARAEAAGELHQVAEQLRGLSGSDSLSAEELAALERLGRGLWQRRHDLFAALTADLPAAAQEQARADLMALALLWSGLRVRLARPAQKEAARREALRVVEELEQTLGPSVVLDHERARHERRLGLVGQARRRRPIARSSWEHCALGCLRLRGGDLKQARLDLARAVDLAPGNFWAHFYLGRCDLRLARHEEALLAFTACVALRPDQPLCYLHRSMAHALLGRRAAALRDVDRALQIDPGHGACRAFRRTLLEAPQAVLPNGN